MISIKEIADARGFDEEFILEFLQEFYDYTMNTDFPGLRRALENHDLGYAAERAHSIKGAAQNLMLDEIGDCAEKILSNCRAGESSELMQLADTMEHHIISLRTFLDSNA
jgi:HPt (histidine-containing phosphotransfer) domain-containing protein